MRETLELMSLVFKFSMLAIWRPHLIKVFTAGMITNFIMARISHFCGDSRYIDPDWSLDSMVPSSVDSCGPGPWSQQC